MKNRCSLAGRLGSKLLLLAILCVVTAGTASTQTPTAADGPWSGWAQCVLTAQLNGPAETYLNQQTHTWVLTAQTPTSGTDIKQYASTWTVKGQGSHQRQYGDGRLLTEQWVTAGQTMLDTLSIRAASDGILHITSGAQLRSTDAVNGTSTTRSINGNARDENRVIAYYVDEWPFPVVEDAATKTALSGSSMRSVPSSVAPGQPPGTMSTAACSWQFVRGGAAASNPPPVAGPVAQAPPTPSPAPAPAVAAVPGVVTAGPAPTPTVTALPGVVIAGPAPTPTVTALPGVITAGPAPTPPSTTAPAAPASTTATAAPVLVTTTSPTTPTTTATMPGATIIERTNQRQAFTASGTFTVPNGVGSLTVELWGAGAGGAGGNNATSPQPFIYYAGAQGHGGGGGAYTRIVLSVSPGTTLGVVVGAGGAGGEKGQISVLGARGVNGANGSSTQLTLKGVKVAEAAGGKGDGSGGVKFSESGVDAVAGGDGTPAGLGGAAIPGSMSPPGTAGGAGGAGAAGGCGLRVSYTCLNGEPGAAGLPGYALISWDPPVLRTP